MSPWITVALSGGLLALVVGYAIAHFIPGRYRRPQAAQLAGVDDGVYVVLNPG